MTERNFRSWRYFIIRGALVLADILVILVGTWGLYWAMHRSGNAFLQVPPVIMYWSIGNVVVSITILALMRMYTMVHTSVGFQRRCV